RLDMLSALGSSEVTAREYRIERDGELQVWDARYLPLSAERGAAPDQRLLVSTDVSEQRAAQEARLEAAIAQREMLVKEVHHRIKNNLQGVAGLLQQIARRKPEVAGAIDEVVGQVQAIAQVYGLQVGDTGPPSLVRVLEAITASVQRTFGRTIESRLDGDDVAGWILPEVDAIPIALILNELLTNAIKHSAAGEPEEPIACAIAGGAGGVRIAVANRARLPDGFSLARIPNGVSGLGLVRALLPRRSATLRIEQEGEQVVATVVLHEPVVVRPGGA
ncbi:MAG: sensor histidine kinase, partial [Caldimonas sp.]